MLFDLAFDDAPTMILVRDEDGAVTVAEPPALPFPLLRRKAADPEPEPAIAFELVPRTPSAVACA